MKIVCSSMFAPITSPSFTGPNPEIESGGDRTILYGDIPSPTNPSSGCVFRIRYRLVDEECATTAPPLREVSPGKNVACIKV